MEFPKRGAERDHRDAAMTAQMILLWVKDAARGRFGDYHWESRRRRLREFARQRSH
ncbi:MAG: hypothetical protein ACXVYV_02590 [Gaiellales bacterium]